MVVGRTLQALGHVVVRKLPELGPADSKRRFKRTIKTLLEVPPPEKGESVKIISDWVDGQAVRLKLLPNGSGIFKVPTLESEGVLKALRPVVGKFDPSARFRAAFETNRH